MPNTLTGAQAAAAIYAQVRERAAAASRTARSGSVLGMA